MNSLNTDCLIEVVKLLNLKDQIAVWQASGSLQTAVTTLWMIRFKHVHINFLEVDLTDQEFAIFLKTLQEIVEILQLRFLNKEKYEILKKYRFERVTDLRLTLSKPYFLQDSDLKDLCKITPNLKAFSPHGNLTGLNISEWPLLKDLNLSFCFKIEMLHFEKILNDLKLEKLKLNIFPNNNQFEQMNLQEAHLENLKYLEMNTYELYYFLTKPLPALKELIITNHYNARQLFDVLLSVWQANDMRLVETANVDNILVNCVEMNLNVEQLTIVNDENPLPANIIYSLHLLSDLRKLRFKNCFINSKDFINLLKNINQLHEISFENCQFDVANICLKVDEIFINRSGNLRLNMFENTLMDNTQKPTWLSGLEEIIYISVDLIGNPNRLELTHSQGGVVCYEPLYILYR